MSFLGGLLRTPNISSKDLNYTKSTYFEIYLENPSQDTLHKPNSILLTRLDFYASTKLSRVQHRDGIPLFSHALIEEMCCQVLHDVVPTLLFERHGFMNSMHQLSLACGSHFNVLMPSPCPRPNKPMARRFCGFIQGPSKPWPPITWLT